MPRTRDSYGFMRRFLAKQEAAAELDHARELRAVKSEVMEIARDAATRDGGRQPTLTDYFHAAYRIASQPIESLTMAEREVRSQLEGLVADENRRHPENPVTLEDRWNPRVFADLSGQKIEGFLIRRDDIEPPANRLKELEGLYNLDADGSINDFYAQVRTHISFQNSELRECISQPADTVLRKYDDTDPTKDPASITRGATFVDMEFRGLPSGEQLVLPDRDYQGTTRVTGINGGMVTLAQGVEIPQLVLEGAEGRGPRADLYFGHDVTVGHLSAAQGQLMVFHTDISADQVRVGAHILSADLRDTVFSPDSSMQGIHLGSTDGRVDLTGAQLIDVDMRGARLVNVELSSRDGSVELLKGLNLDGAHITNLSIDGRLISSPAELEAFGISVENATVRLTDAARERAQAQPAPAPVIPPEAIAAVMPLHDALFARTLNSTTVAVQERLAVAEAAVPPALSNPGVPSISGGEDVDIAETRAPTEITGDAAKQVEDFRRLMAEQQVEVFSRSV